MPPPPRSGQMYARLLPDILMDRVPTTTDGTPLPVAVREACALLAACCFLLCEGHGAAVKRGAALLCCAACIRKNKRGESCLKIEWEPTPP